MDQIRASWVQALRAQNRSPETIRSYSHAVSSLLRAVPNETPEDQKPQVNGVEPVPNETPPAPTRHLDGDDGQLANGLANGVPTRHQIRAYLDHQLRTRSPGTAAIRHRALVAFFKWAVAEGELDHNPMIGVKAPRVPERPVPVLTDSELERLLAIPGLGFHATRDRAILRLFIGSGVRLSELAGLQSDSVSTQERTARVLGKGSRPRVVGLSSKTVDALESYFWVREVHRHAGLPGLWLGPAGVLHAKAIYSMVRRRAEAAGVDGCHPHLFRHAFADRWLRAGGQEGDLLRIAGWSNSAMLQRYGASLATERALKAHERLGVGDNLG